MSGLIEVPNETGVSIDVLDAYGYEIQGYTKVLEGEEKVPDDDATNLSAAQEQAKKTNSILYAELLLSCNDEVSFGCVASAKTDVLKKGQASLAWSRLKDRYESTSATCKVQARKQFANCRLKYGQDPDIWIMTLERYKTRLHELFDTEMDDVDLMIHIINNMSREYDDMIDSLELQLGATHDTLDMKKLKEQLRSKFGRLTKQKEREKDKEKTTNLRRLW